MKNLTNLAKVAALFATFVAASSLVGCAAESTDTDVKVRVASGKARVACVGAGCSSTPDGHGVLRPTLELPPYAQCYTPANLVDKNAKTKSYSKVSASAASFVVNIHASRETTGGATDTFDTTAPRNVVDYCVVNAGPMQGIYASMNRYFGNGLTRGSVSAHSGEVYKMPSGGFYQDAVAHQTTGQSGSCYEEATGGTGGWYYGPNWNYHELTVSHASSWRSNGLIQGKNDYPDDYDTSYFTNHPNPVNSANQLDLSHCLMAVLADRSVVAGAFRPPTESDGTVSTTLDAGTYQIHDGNFVNQD